MIIHSVMPLEEIFKGMEDEQPAVEEINLNGMIMEVQSVNKKQARIVRLISPNPQDYLNPSYAPGELINLLPHL